MRLTIEGVDVDGTPMSLFKKVEVELPETFVTHDRKRTLAQEPFEFEEQVTSEATTTPVTFHVHFHFMGWYNEPMLSVPVTVAPTADRKEIKLSLGYDVTTGEWQYEMTE